MSDTSFRYYSNANSICIVHSLGSDHFRTNSVQFIAILQIMNKIASVVYAYSPKNDDELELTVGDKIEVLGYEQEGKSKI